MIYKFRAFAFSSYLESLRIEPIIFDFSCLRLICTHALSGGELSRHFIDVRVYLISNVMCPLILSLNKPNY